MIESTQDKQKEIAFFDGHAAADRYDVFTPVFAPDMMKPLRSFVPTYGEMP